MRVERRDAELHITLDHAERRNAYSAAMRDGLVDALSLAEVDDTITHILLAGEGPSFCAGGDLTEFGTNTDGGQSHLLRTRGGAAAPLHRLAPRVEAVVHGPCIGAGIELPAFAATVRVRGEATFRLPEVQMGLIPGAGGTASIPRRIGRHRTFWLAVTGTAIGARTALRWGLTDAVDPAD
ncbi:MAG: enoyl-CoA hydratase/isomerase family protein [Humibacter sp.]